MNNPSPVPLSDFVANFVNSLGNISGSIPLPVSFMYTRRAAGTTAQSRYAPSAPGRATGTSPRARQDREHRWNRCGTRRRRRVRTHSCLAPRECR